MIAKELRTHPLARVTSVLKELEISPATYYRRLQEEVVPASTCRPRLPWPPEWIAAVKHTYRKHPTYGYRMIWGLLKKERIPKKAVRKILQRSGLVQGKSERIHLKRDLSKLKRPDGVNQVWQMDITHLFIERYGFYFLINVVDYFSRYLIASVFSETYATRAVISTLQQALDQAVAIHGSMPGPVRLVTDNGPSFISRGFMAYLREVRAFDHVRVGYRSPELIGLLERLHRTLKQEAIWPMDYLDPLHAKQHLEEFVRYYNSERPHSRLGYETPWSVYAPKEVQLAA